MASKLRESWLPIPGCPGYEVSSLGRVRNELGGVHRAEENRDRWMQVVVRGYVGDGSRIMKRVVEVHRLVAAVFLGLGGAVGHRDGDRGNNAASNLVGCSSEREAREMSGLLRYRRGSGSPLAKLSEAEVGRIRELRARGWTLVELGRKFGVAHQLVSRICAGKAWREA